MDRTELRALIIAELVKIAPDVDPQDVPDDDDLRDALDLDSMDFMRLLSAVHSRTGVNIPESDYRQVLQLGQMMSYIEARASAG